MVSVGTGGDRDDIPFHSLSTTESRLASFLLLTASLVPRLLLLLICQSGEGACDLANLDILEGLGNIPGELLSEGCVKRLRLVSFNDELDDL